MSIANPNYTFNVTEQQGTYTINWKAAKLGLGVALPLIIPAIAFGLVYGNFTSDNNISSFLTNSIIGAILFIAGIMLISNLLIRRGGQFSFTKDSFVLNGTHYPNKDIKGLYIKTPKGERESVRVYTTAHGFGVSGTLHNVGQGAVALNDELGRAMRNSIRKRSYKVCIQYGEREITLARHLTAQTAKALLGKIDELI